MSRTIAVPAGATSKLPLAGAKPAGQVTRHCRTYNIRLWPTLYLLDKGGVIRFRGHEVAELERVLDGLLKNPDGRTGSK